MDNRILTNALLGSTEVFKFEIESVIQHVIASRGVLHNTHSRTDNAKAKKKTIICLHAE